MSSKRKRAPVKKPANKRGKRKEESDIDSELSDSSENENGPQQDEILIAGHGDALDEPIKLPEELLKTLIKPAGQLFLFGNVNWDTAGRKDTKNAGRVVPNLYRPHRFTDLKVKRILQCLIINYNLVYWKINYNSISLKINYNLISLIINQVLHLPNQLIPKFSKDVNLKAVD